jgi:hypothetical protein
MVESHPQAFDSSSVETIRVVEDGLVAGLLGALVVAGTHLLADGLAGEPFRTPTVLGVLFVDGAAAAQNAKPSFDIAFRFTCLHIAGWVILGFIGSWLISVVEARPRLASYAFAGFAFAFITLLYAAGAFSVPGLPQLHLWLGTLVGSVAAAGYLAWRHPKVAGHIKRQNLTETTLSELERALEHEAADLAAYCYIAETFPSPVFAKMIEEKRARSALLRARCDKLGLAPSQNPETAHKWTAENLREALDEAITFEQRTIDFYDRFLAVVPELEIRNVFLRLRYHVLDTTISELRRAIETEA